MAFLFFQTSAGVGFRAKCITFGLLHAELLKNTFLMISKNGFSTFRILPD
tara:strand:- start:22 stop:171 length:150 start_codon:yes stop_codon:yes gene_type:complete